VVDTFKRWAPVLDDAKGPKYVQIATALIEDIAAGNLRPGDQLPPQRELAAIMGVTVGTVARAFAEVMRGGHIEASFRRGTRVVDRKLNALGAQVEADPSLKNEIVDLRGHQAALPHWGTEVAAATRSCLDSDNFIAALRYGEIAGGKRQRGAGARWLMAPGAGNVTAEQVIVTNGAQHGLLCALMAMCSPGEVVATESLTYSGLKTVAPHLRLRLLAIDLDQDGIVPEAFERACRAHAIKVLVCVPNLHNPTTVTLVEQRRFDIAEIARQYNVQIIEDDVYSRLAEQELPRLSDLAPLNTVRITSFSKCLGPGLRVGYLQAPSHLVSAITDAVRATSWMASPLCVEVATSLVESGHADDLLRENRQELAKRNNAFLDAIGQKGAAGALYCPHAWVEVPAPWTSQLASSAALIRGYSVSPGDSFACDRDRTVHGFRISVGAAKSVKELESIGRSIRSILLSAPRADDAP
jgi:DNA-binding transcriptional MocR family regulator